MTDTTGLFYLNRELKGEKKKSFLLLRGKGERRDWSSRSLRREKKTHEIPSIGREKKEVCLVLSKRKGRRSLGGEVIEARLLPCVFRQKKGGGRKKFRLSLLFPPKGGGVVHRSTGGKKKGKKRERRGGKDLNVLFRGERKAGQLRAGKGAFPSFFRGKEKKEKAVTHPAEDIEETPKRRLNIPIVW